MHNDLKHVAPLPGHRLQVELVDGTSGVFDVTPYLSHPGMGALRDEAYFVRVTVLCGAATWPDGEDIAPDTLAAGIHAAQAA